MTSRARYKSLLSNSAIYLISSIINSALPFLLLPILTSYLAPAEFGMLGIFQGLYTALLAIVGLGTGSAIVRKSYELSPADLSIYIFNAISLMVISLILLLSVSVIFQAPIKKYLEIPLSWIHVCILLAALMFVTNVYLSQLQVQQKPKLYGAFQISHSATNLAFSLFFVIGLTWGAPGRILGILLAAGIFSFIALRSLKRRNLLRPQWRKSYFADAFKFGAPLVPHELGTFFLTWFAMFVINTHLEKDAVGIYLFAFQISMILGVCADAFNKAYVPWLFAKLKHGDLEQKKGIVKLTYLYFAGMVLISTASFALGPYLIPLLFNEKYAPAGMILGFLVTGQALGGSYLMVTNYIIYSQKTVLLSYITFISSVASIGLSLILVNKYGIAGAAVSFLCTRFIMFLLTWLIAAYTVKMPWISGFRS